MALTRLRRLAGGRTAAVAAGVPAGRAAVPVALAARAAVAVRDDRDVDAPTGRLRLADHARHPERLVVGMSDDDEHGAVRRRRRVRVALPVDLHDAHASSCPAVSAAVIST